MKKQALVTGGAGLIGSHIVDLLLERGCDVRVLDSLEETTHPHGRPDWVPADVEFIEADVRDVGALTEALRGVDIVFHQAAFGGFVPEISKYVDVNAGGTAKLFEAITANNFDIEKIVVASSQAVYGEGKYACLEHGVQFPAMRGLDQLERGRWEVDCPACGAPMDPLPTDETKPLAPTKIYAMSKYAEEQIALNLGREFGLPTVCLRYSLTYGPRQSIYNPYTGVCSIFSTRLLNDLPVVVFEDGIQTRDFVFVKDVARANLLVMDSPEADYRAFNVGTGRNTTVLEFVEELARTYGVEARTAIKNQFRPGEVRHLFAGTENIGALGYEPLYDIRSGLAEYARWIKTQGSLSDYFAAAEVGMRNMGIIKSAA